MFRKFDLGRKRHSEPRDEACPFLRSCVLHCAPLVSPRGGVKSYALAQVLARVSYQLLLAAPRSSLLEPFGPSPVHVCAKPVRSSSPGFAFTGGQRAACRVCLRLLLAKD